jgi:hypothetical protein
MRSKSFCLDRVTHDGLTAVVMPLSSSSMSPIESLAGYPPWFVAACVTVVGVVLVWLAAKLLKWSLYLLMVLVLVAGIATSIWLFFR